jgi:hypothetical protein
MDAAVVPEGLAAMPPGPGLAAALGAIELGRVPNDRMLEVLVAQHRQLSHEQARMAATLTEVGRCDGIPAPGAIARLAEPDRYAPEETRAALRWTRNAADFEHEFAEAVVHTMPAVFAAWWAGDIDRPRVRVFHRYLTGLTAEVVARICAAAVPRAPKLTTGQLAHLLHRMVIAADPDAADRWYRKGVQRRGVFAHLDADGTVTLSANGLPADEAEAACARIEALADAAKRAGHPGRIGQIRCDLFLGLLDGRFNGMTTDEVVAALLAQRPSTAPTCSGNDSAPAADDRAEGRPSGEEPSAGPGGSGPGGGARRDDRRGIEIRVGLSTLLGLDEHPAEIPGLGPLVAPAARHRVAQQRRAQWRFAVTDEDGMLLTEGVTRRRPGSVHRAPGPPGGIVELHVPLTLLRQLVADGSGGEWAGVIADVAEQHARSAEHLRDLDARPGARLPSAALRRHTEIRDRTCTHPCCRRPAHASEQDHTRHHAHGGATVRANLGPTCPHDHGVKHEGGWDVEQPRPGTFIWRSPLGGRYPSRGEFLDPPMPDPGPGVQQPDEEDDRFRYDEDPILRMPPPRPTQERGPPSLSDPDEPAPF